MSRSKTTPRGTVSDQSRKLTETVIAAKALHDQEDEPGFQKAIADIWVDIEPLTMKHFSRFTKTDSPSNRDDLWQQLYFELIHCVLQFNPSYGFAFSTYWTNAVRHELGRWRIPLFSLIRVPHYLHGTRDPRSPVNSQCRKAADAVFAHSERREHILERIPACRDAKQEEDAREAMRVRVLELVAELPDRHRHVLEAQYGLGRDRLVLREIGDELGVTKQRVAQIRIEAVNCLRESLLRDLEETA